MKRLCCRPQEQQPPCNVFNMQDGTDPSSDTRRNRLDLAQWIISPEHPLTARVRVNRIWMRLFGRGLVETENDFGIQGTLPTHPQLLDWLAAEFRDSGWSTKRLLRLIMLMAAMKTMYRSL